MQNKASKAEFRTRQCIFCDNVLGQKTKPEHILLDSLGGKKTTTVAICSDCNQTFGSTIDKVMPDRLKLLRNMFQMRSGSGDLPPALRQMDTANGKVGFANNGSPRPARGAPFTVKAIEEGRWDVSFNVASEDELRFYVPHAAAKMGMTEDRLWAQIEGKTATRRTDYVGAVHSRFHCDGEEVIRSIVKSALVLLATRTGTKALREPAFAAARDFVVMGSESFLEEHTTADARQIPAPTYDRLIAAYGPMFNMIYVKSNAQGRVVAYFYLYNLLAWQIVLASNPLDTQNWSDEVSAAAPLDFEWLDQPDNTACNEVALQRFSVIMELYQDRSRKQIIRSTLDQVLGNPDREPRSERKHLMEEKLDRATIQVLSEKLVIAIMQIPTEESFTLARFAPALGEEPTGEN